MKHPKTGIIINASAFYHNVSQYKSVIGRRKLALVVKANAYGHGIYLIAQLADNNPDIAMLCVATAAEALLLRNRGIKKPLLILSILNEDPVFLLHKNIACTVYDLQTALYLNTIGQKNNSSFVVHLKVDTGLSRFGIDYKKAVAVIQQIRKLPYIRLDGIYSHCAEAHKKDQSYTLKQVDRFAALIKEVQQLSIAVKYVHFANSAATTVLDLPFCNLFRVGVGAYGLWPSNENKKCTQERYPHFFLTPIATWKTSILSIKHIKKGSFIGYDRTFRALCDMRIATLPVGYYDGYDFQLSNKASVLVQNQYAPVVGRISMNVCIIDVTNIPRVAVGNDVIIMGPYSFLDPMYLSDLAGSINVREMITKINPVIERTLLSEKKSSNQPSSVTKKKYTIASGG